VCCVCVWVLGCWRGCVWVKVQICIWPNWCHCYSLSLAPVNPDWFYRLTRVVPDKIQADHKMVGCVCVCVYVCVLVTGFKQPLQTNDFITLYMLPFISLHFLCTHFWHLVHCIELLSTPLPQTPCDHLAAAFCITFCHSPLIITLVLFIFTLMPLFSTLSFHSLSLLIRSSVSAITTKSSAYSCHGNATLNSLDSLLYKLFRNSLKHSRLFGLSTYRRSKIKKYDRVYNRWPFHIRISINAVANWSFPHPQLKKAWDIACEKLAPVFFQSLFLFAYLE